MPVMLRKFWKSVLTFCLGVGLVFIYSTGAMAEPHQEIARGVAAMDAGRLTEAEQHFRKAVKESPLLWEAHYQLGMLLKKQERLPEAAESFREAESLWSIPQTVGWLTDTLSRLRRFPECRSAAERWVKIQPSSLVALDNLGQCSAGERDYATSVDAFSRGIALEDVPERQFGLANAAYGLGDYTTAREAARKGMEQMPQAPGGEALLGRIELALGNIAEAKRLLGNKPMLGLIYAHTENGWRVFEVLRNGPAERADIRVNDFVTHFNGQPLPPDGQGLAPLVSAQSQGAKVILTLRREGREIIRQAVLSLDADESDQDRKWQPSDTAKDSSQLTNSMRIHGVFVEPAEIAAGASFRIVIELTANVTSGDQPIPITIGLSILQGSKSLSQTEWSEHIQPQRRMRVIKEISRAAGEPGAYAIRVEARSGSERAVGMGGFKIIDHR
ncbi:MAG: tetratricopeptide repeat protein [Pseudomonadota bacterium]